MPFDLARCRVDPETRRRVEVIACAVVFLTRVAQPRVPGRGVAGAEDQRIGIRVIGTTQPGRAATGLPHVAGPGRVQRAGHGALFAVERAHVTFDHRTLPGQFTGFRITCLHRPDDSELTARIARHDQTVHDQWCGGVAVTGLVIRDLLVPNRVARLGVQRDDARIQRAEIDVFAIKRRPAVDHVTARQDAFGQTRVILPKLFAGFHIDGIQPRIGPGDIHDTVMHQRLGFLAALLFTTQRKRPGGNKILDVVPVKRVQRRIPLQVAAHAVGQYILRGCGIIRQHFFGDARSMPFRECRCCQQAYNGCNDEFVHFLSSHRPVGGH